MKVEDEHAARHRFYLTTELTGAAASTGHVRADWIHIIH